MIWGINRLRPARPITTMPTARNASGGRRSASRMAEKARVTRAKLAASPTVTPRGRQRPPATEEASTTGSTGSTQGEMIVAIPDRKATPSSNIMIASPPLTMSSS